MNPLQSAPAGNNTPIRIQPNRAGLVRACALGALLAGGAAMQAAPPTPVEILQFKPKQEGISPSMPKSGDESSCKVELIKGQEKGSGWLLRDTSGQPLRRFFDTNDDNKSDVRSYYQDGIEIYREIDSNFDGTTDQYRWFNGAGSRWGIDANGDGTIDTWQVISPEELSQEMVRALSARDQARFNALLLNANDLKQMGLNPEKAAIWADKVAGAAGRFSQAAGKLPAGAIGWLHLELGVPQCLPADQIGSRYDLIRHRRGTILLDLAGKTEWLQTGEMVQVGAAWRVVEGPALGALTEEDPTLTAGTRPLGKLDFDKDPDLRKMVEDLGALDRQIAQGSPTPKQHMARADLLAKIAGKLKPEDRDPWLRQIADSLSSAAQGPNNTGDPAAMNRLLELATELVKANPGTPLTGYVVFRQMQAEYSIRLMKPGEDFSKVQQDWIGKLTQFVSTYPTADDTADALIQLGMVSEFMGKPSDAKNWYQQVGKNFAGKPQALKAAGAIRRLNSDGQPYALSGVSLDGTGANFDMGQVQGKVLVVYFWASWNNQTVGDFAKLKLIAESYKAKGMELVTVNCDQTAAEGLGVMKRTPIPGIHLHQPGGLDGKLCTEWGLMVLPHLVVVGKDGKVASGNAQLATLEEDVNKLTK
jgi:Thioredoxin-like